MQLRRSKYLWLVALAAAALAVWLISSTLFVFRGHLQGVFLLSGRDGYRWVLKDDLFLGDGSRVLWSCSFGPLRRLFGDGERLPRGERRLNVVWDAEDGAGWVRNAFGDGTELHTYFSRFEDSAGAVTHGLFVGGGSASVVVKDHNAALNDTGMAYYDGQRWLHLWCSVNEGIRDARHLDVRLPPSSWRFLDSQVLIRSPQRAVLSSRHQVTLDGEPLLIERFAYFRAGESYFKLGIRLTNTGQRPLSYIYLYGDEPWVGAYGSSAANLGWAKGRILPFETTIDPQQESYAGLVDSAYGVANFIEWLGPNKPSLVYISNVGGRYAPVNDVVPLVSDERFIGLKWGPRTLVPGQSDLIFLVIGMAPLDPRSGVPIKPEIPPSDYLQALERLDDAP